MLKLIGEQKDKKTSFDPILFPSEGIFKTDSEATSEFPKKAISEIFCHINDIRSYHNFELYVT